MMLSKHPECENKMILQLVADTVRLQELVFELAEMVIGLTREQYAQNLLNIEQGGAESLKKVNEDLLEKMARILTFKAQMEDHVARNSQRSNLISKFKLRIKRSVEEYLKGMP